MRTPLSEEVRKLVSGIDHEPEYWHGTREMANLRSEDDVTERVVMQNFRRTKVEQRVTLKPNEAVEVDYMGGATVGKRSATAAEVGESGFVVRERWDVGYMARCCSSRP